MQQLLPQIEAEGAHLAAISHMVLKYADPLGSRLGLTYPLRSDRARTYLEQLGVVFELPAGTISPVQ